MESFTPQRIRALIEAGAGVVGQVDLGSLLGSAVETAMDLTGARYGALGVIGEHGTLIDFVHRGLDAETASKIGHLPRGEGVLGTITNHAKTVRIEEIADHPDSVGYPDHHPVMHSFLGCPVRVGDRVFGNLYLAEKEEGFTEEDEVLVELIAVTAGAAISTLRLQERLRRAALSEDRERIARDLHDSIIQDLFAVGLALQASIGRIESDPGSVRARVDEAVDRIDAAIASLRRFIFDLQPPVWAQPGLASRLNALISELSKPHDIEVGLEVECPPGVPDTVIAGHLVAIVGEAVSNALRHADATDIGVTVQCQGDRVLVSVSDDGSGFDTSKTQHGLGLGNMARRVATAGGVYGLQSREGKGTTIRVELPVK
ncbi:MAG TPA: GAF domain-containing sensor histidine kinase [Acidimicrobiia bacterium]|nr:GAF domain-containing sensor histidine kinase [Acidimicrobiia bacterium]